MGKGKKGVLRILPILFLSGFILLGLLILYPFWRLFVWVVNCIGVNGIRNTGRNLETPVIFYEHPETKKKIVFVATIHFAEPEYFARLQRLIESLSGYTVLFEGVGRLSSEEEQFLTEKEREVARNFEYLWDGMRKIGDVMSLQSQRDGLAYNANWVNTDMRLCDVIRLFARYDVRIVKKEKNLDDVLNDESARIFFRYVMNALLSRFASTAVILGILALFSRDKRLAKKFILDARNEVAVRGINEYLTSRDVATIWGAGHLRGIEKQLKQIGFREVRRKWFVAYRVRDYRLLKCLKEMASISKAAGAAITPEED